ncbi:permease prefix domain 1-containing protein [Clostridium sp. MD294]|uniref:permease prefix domain 1-containing protein n=1 Tax=Clostridium sp. MD294 TaxID=97138 RepID=UPI0002CA91CA|nr:permease prefix domain 1-containing protein [Clostridium sp. MD294]NDO46588.1 hypothetical protein [Clostridium sp. MD294]USF28981.1 hypothetical protein C820_000364 [Clostridium sp. MD294]
MLTNIKSYLDTVCEQIHFQKAHNFVKKELQDHIIDQTDAFIQQGFEKEIAVQKAIEQMGDPVLVGTELDRVHRPAMKWSFIVFVILFSLASFALKWIILPQNAELNMPITKIILRTVMGILTSTITIVLFYKIDFTVLANRSFKIYFCYVLLIGFLFFYGPVYGIQYRSRIFLYGFMIPPLIYFFPVILTGLLYDCRGKSYSAILLCAASFLPPAFFSIHMANGTATFIIAGINLLLILYAICKGWFSINKRNALLILFVLMVLSGVFVCFLSPEFIYRISRIYISIKDINTDWIRNTLQHNVKGAALFGEGNSFSYYGADGKFIELTPTVQYLGTEYFVNYALHYFGWIVFILSLAIYTFFIVKAFILAHKEKSQLGSMTAYAILLTISVIAVWNIVCTSGYFITINPLELPFFSSASTINTVYCALMGILLSVFRIGKYTSDEAIECIQTVHKNNGLFELKRNKEEFSITIHLKKAPKSQNCQKGEDLLE